MGRIVLHTQQARHTQHFEGVREANAMTLMLLESRQSLIFSILSRGRTEALTLQCAHR